MKEADSNRCIICVETKPIEKQITMEFGKGNLNTDYNCVKCYSNYAFNCITYQNC